MNRSIILVTLIALVVAVLVAVVVSKTLGGGSGDQTAGNISTTQILVAANKLKIGDEITPDDLKWMAWPDEAMFDGVIKRKTKKPDDGQDKKAKKESKDKAEGQITVQGEGRKDEDEEEFAKVEPGKDRLVGKMVRRAVKRNEPVTMDVVIEDSDSGSILAAKLEPGMRAIGVKIKAESSAGGFIKPGDYVDVILTYQIRNAGGQAMAMLAQRLATQTILSNVRVLAVDQTAQPSGEKDKDKIKVGKTATLELTRKQAETLALAEQMGELTLVLRRLGEDDAPEDEVSMDFTTDVRTADVLRRQAEIISSGGTSTANTVRVYSGPQVNSVPVQVMTLPEPEQNSSN